MSYNRVSKIYIHEGKGHWIGSVVVVTAPNRAKAEEKIREYLDSVGLQDEPIEITKWFHGSDLFRQTEPLYAQSGDY